MRDALEGDSLIAPPTPGGASIDYWHPDIQMVPVPECQASTCPWAVLKSPFSSVKLGSRIDTVAPFFQFSCIQQLKPGAFMGIRRKQGPCTNVEAESTAQSAVEARA